ncbi:hypothetical protein TMatcc_009282 [Talaromyces marneffei ATCC 18224]
MLLMAVALDDIPEYAENVPKVVAVDDDTDDANSGFDEAVNDNEYDCDLDQSLSPPPPSPFTFESSAVEGSYSVSNRTTTRLPPRSEPLYMPTALSASSAVENVAVA